MNLLTNECVLVALRKCSADDSHMADGKEHLHDFARFLKGVPCGSAVLKSDVSHCQCVRLQKTCLRVGRVETFPSKWQQLQNIDMSVTFM